MSKPTSPKRQLTLFDSICMIIGVIIGVGVFQTTPFIANLSGSPATLLWMWLAGGVIALLGAMCYAELTTSFPRDGGDYIFLSRAYGPRTSFLFVWAEYWIIRPASIGMMAFVFADYAYELLRLAGPDSIPETPSKLALASLASVSIVALVLLNLLGVAAGKWTQNILTVAKVIGLVVVIGAGLMLEPTAVAPAKPTDGDNTNLQLAMVLVLFTYGGWNEISYVAAEVKNPQRNLTLALFGGIVGITVIYFLFNLAVVRLLGYDGFANAGTVASTAVTPRLGWWAGAGMSVLIAISCLGAINSLVFTGSRLYYAIGLELPVFSWLGVWNARFDAPLRSMGIQAGVSLLTVVVFGAYDDSFTHLLYFTTPIFWFFILMVIVSLFILRHRPGADPSAFRIPGYPFTPMLFCIVCAGLFQSSLIFAVQQHFYESLWATRWMLVGLVVAWFGLPRSDQGKVPEHGDSP